MFTILITNSQFYTFVEDETSDNSCGVRQFAKISFNDKDLLGRLSGKKNTDITERVVTGKGVNTADGIINMTLMIGVLV